VCGDRRLQSGIEEKSGVIEEEDGALTMFKGPNMSTCEIVRWRLPA